jgi:hypothetical protein
MPENAAQDRGRGRPLPVSAYSIVERRRVEIAVEGKWPKAWRILFLAGAALLLWAIIAALIRWL